MSGNTSFGLRTRDGNPFNFDFELFTQPDPGFRLKLPAMKVFMDLPTNVDDLTLNTPAIDFDSSGAFDTGKISLPSFDFDGVPVTNETDGPKADNYIRLRRTAAGKVSFTTKAVLEPFDNCEGDFSLTIERQASGSLSVDGSMTSNFCVLPFTLSMGYDSSRSTCQFFFEADGWRVLFGRASGGGLCAEVWTGVDDDGNGGVRLLPF